MICLSCLEIIPASAHFCAYCGAQQMTDAEAHLREVNSQHVRDYLGLPYDDELPLASAGWIPLLIHLHSSVEETIDAGHDPYDTCKAAGRIVEKTMYDYWRDAVNQRLPQSESEHD